MIRRKREKRIFELIEIGKLWIDSQLFEKIYIWKLNA
jgi:hypothetical protein